MLKKNIKPDMKLQFLIFIYFFFPTQIAFGQVATNQFFTWDGFVDNFGEEIASAESVYNRLVADGLQDKAFSNFTFVFHANEKANLLKLKEFIRTHYPYKLEDIKQIDGIWQLHGMTNEIPVTLSNVMFWVLDMLKRGYECDAKLDSYRATFDPENLKYPDFETSKENYYFQKGVEAYSSGDLSGSIINWSNVLLINPKNPNAYYSRAIVKNELYAWKSALRDYDNSIELKPNFVSALLNRGSLKDENGDYEGAIQDYDRVIELSADDVEDKRMAFFNRGNTKYNLQEKKGACEDWKKSYELGTDDALERTKKYCKDSNITISPLQKSSKKNTF